MSNSNTSCRTEIARALLGVLLVPIAPMQPRAHAADKPADDARVEAVLNAFFERIGGREVFAKAKGEYIAIEIQDPENSAVPYYFEFCASYESPRSATRMNALNATVLSAYDRGEGWTVSKPRGKPAVLKDWSEARKKLAADDWRGNFETLTHRLAARDPLVKAVMGKGPWEGWLEIFENGEPVFHLLINDKGEPVQFRRILDDRAVRFGPLVDFGSYRFPSSGHFEGSLNTFDFHVFQLINESLTRAFSRPADIENPAMDCR